MGAFLSGLNAPIAKMMKLNYYFSGSPPLTNEARDRLAIATPCRLLSCHGSYIKYGHSWMEAVMRGEENSKKNTILLDSGAFTAWNQGHEMLLKDLLPVYYDFMSKYWQNCKEIYLINLDKIPGSPGRTADEKEIQECIEISDKNYEILVNWFGKRVLPVFHQGEPESRLYEVEAMGEYICVSPRNDLGEVHRVKWSREVHSKLKAETKTHGLAATGISMMTTVPWYSVDSASYLFTASTGTITLVLNGKMVNIAVSDKSPLRKDAEQHITTLNKSFRKVFDERIEYLGYTVDELASSANSRAECNMREIQFWVDNHHKFEIAKTPSLFDL